tara:strand:+ start:480 stop:1217 length:738 start_codon:yes stop_codon:yes gene_type:complete
MTITSLITVRSASSRLQSKCYLPFGEYTVIEHIIKRSLKYNLNPIICTTFNESDDEIVNIAKKCNIRYFRGPDINKLLRWKMCCEKYNVELFHTIDADDPFFCGEEVKRSFHLLLKGYDMIEPTLSSSNGAGTVGYSLRYSIVKKICDNLAIDTNTEMIWNFIKHDKNAKCKVLPEPGQFIIKERLTLDYEEDYEMLVKLRNYVGNFASREEVYKALINNNDLVKINKFRNSEWKKNQIMRGKNV